MRFINQIKTLVALQSEVSDVEPIVFYSEGKNYWPYLKGMISGLVDLGETNLLYVSSDPDDPGLQFKTSLIKSFEIGSGFCRDWFFANFNSGILVMTMPDLNQYQVKRSKSSSAQYIYVQHSLVSLHMMYRPGAFDFYDTIFCSGPHHIKELRRMEELYELPKKNLVEHGYPLLDEQIDLARNSNTSEKSHSTGKHVLIAPSWGENAIIEVGLATKIIDKLLIAGHKITLRPHPETRKHSIDKIEQILEKFSSNDRFFYETNIVGQTSLIESDLMICDWSGVAIEYAFAYQKPVVFIDTPKKINNPNYLELGIEPFEISIREQIGSIATIHNLLEKVEFSRYDQSALSRSIFNIGNSNQVGVEALINLRRS